jgi:hypothetical protein
MRGFNEKLFGDKLVAGQLPTQLGLIGSEDIESLLLDFYPNAAAAYSVRKLKAAYTGSAIRVRRSSDNTEQDIGFVSNVLDTFALTSFCGAGNGFVTTWYDQSGNGRNATQTTASNQPQIVSSGSVITYNGKPTMTYDGLNDFMQSALFNYSTALSVYYVTQRIGNAAAYAPDVSTPNTDSTDGGAFHYINPSLKGASYPFFPNFGNYDGIGNYANGDKYLINYEMTNSVGFNIYRNNSFEGGSNANASIPTKTQGIRIASQENPSRYANNNFSEIIMWFTNQSSNRSAINSDINTYFSVY